VPLAEMAISQRIHLNSSYRQEEEAAMDVRDITDVISNRLQNFTRQDVKSVHFGEADYQDVERARANPRSFVAVAGIETTDDSQYHITFLQRQDRHRIPTGQAVGGVAGQPVARARAARRPIVIVIHYECCCSDVLVLGW